MMRTMVRSLVLMAGALVLVGVLASTSQAQPIRSGIRVGGSTANWVNPNPYIGNGLRLNQAAYNIRVLGSAYASVPPYVYGYNPYPQVVNYGPVYPYVAPTPYPYYQPYPYSY